MNTESKQRFGWYMYDWAISAFSTTVVTVFMGPYLTTIAKTAAASDPNLSVYPLGIEIYSGSYFAYIVSLSVILQVFVLPWIGSIADRKNNKKLILGVSAAIGSIATMLLYFLKDDMYLYGGLTFIIANLAFGISMVVYNAYLNDISPPDRRDAVSSMGWGVGYLGGGLLLFLNLMLVQNIESFDLTMSDAIRISFLSAGMWWAIFTLFPLVLLKTSKHIEPRENTVNHSSFKQVIKTLKSLRNYPVAMTFLIAYLLYNDGVQAVLTLSAHFGQEELGLDMGTLTQVILIVQFVAFVGALFFNNVAKKIGARNTLIICLFIWIITIIYAFAFLYTEAGFYAMGIVIGFVMGGTQALSRSLYSVLIPKKHEAEFFSFYEISERGTSWIGPMMFAISLQLTGSNRIAILSLGVFFVIGIIMMFRVKFDHTK